jgi:hypothetical protein
MTSTHMTTEKLFASGGWRGARRQLLFGSRVWDPRDATSLHREYTAVACIFLPGNGFGEQRPPATALNWPWPARKINYHLAESGEAGEEGRQCSRDDEESTMGRGVLAGWGSPGPLASAALQCSAVRVAALQ